jgi:hypothetical protein
MNALFVKNTLPVMAKDPDSRVFGSYKANESLVDWLAVMFVLLPRDPMNPPVEAVLS